MACFQLARSDIACFQLVRTDIACSSVVHTIFKAKYNRTTQFFQISRHSGNVGRYQVKYMGKLVRNIKILTSLVFPLHPSIVYATSQPEVLLVSCQNALLFKILTKNIVIPHFWARIHIIGTTKDLWF